MNRKKKRPFPGADEAPKVKKSVDSILKSNNQTIHEGERVGGVFGFFRDYGVRETIESILVAVVLALMFRAYEAEAFIIPTGSMAPTLQGQHMDVDCEKCGYEYRTGASLENSTYAPQNRDKVTHTVCPICQYRMRMSRQTNPDHNSNNGDRILVNKFVYDFAEPKRFDVIVFKNPNNGKQNYIKRLIGLPNEDLLIDSGDIYRIEPDESGGASKEIVRKPPHKLKVMLQDVDDTDFIAPELKKAGWPSRWQQWSGEGNWQQVEIGDKTNFILKSNDQENWLRYRHLIPRQEDWQTLEEGRLPKHILSNQLGAIIGDYYCYNDREYARMGLQPSPGAHWVGDLAVEAWTEIKSSSGIVKVDLVEGGAHYTCSIDIETGQAELSCSDQTVQFEDQLGNSVENPTAKTPIRGAGNYRFLYSNADDRIYLWINNREIEFDAPFYKRKSEVRPRWSPNNPGDAEPAGVGAQNAEIAVTRLKILRDVYYSSTNNKNKIQNETNFEDGVSRRVGSNTPTLKRLHRDPQLWEKSQGKAMFRSGKGKSAPMFELKEDQFLPMGDNSPASLDGRVWRGPKHVDRKMLIGRAMFIYWPHSLNKPIPYFPNFEKMGFIR